ncbi:hypothetical protein SSS_00962 [Sarcoptes scabiei]|uniref:Uncharacterized protein n=1 Tax=Sarcoptes scabiei TaxID=52283 RepID=A0A834VE35_SARSC|nr:hypothetical protein SSS_00962 [Sarcoptes scabiei]UXI22648.1 hypothetical protein NH340_JMT08591 [Sarcoptes scabiei]
MEAFLTRNQSDRIWNDFTINLDGLFEHHTSRQQCFVQKSSSNYVSISGDDEMSSNKIIANGCVRKFRILDRFQSFANDLDSKHNFVKLWGNFVNIEDEDDISNECNQQSRSEASISVMKLKQLNNYLVLEDQHDAETCIKFLAQLFPNRRYPKMLYSGDGNAWRMRFNLFVVGIFNDDENSDHNDNINDFNDYDDRKVLHIGELHLYFHLEPKKSSPSYQNLCFFSNKSLTEYDGKKNPLLFLKLLEIWQKFRETIICPVFVKQLIFPIESNRFHRQSDRTVEYFMLRQSDLEAYFEIENNLDC